MKKLTLMAVATVAMAACTAQSGPKGYTINGTLPDSTLNGKEVYLIDSNTKSPIDTATIENSAFAFNGTLTAPGIYRVQAGRTSANVLIEDGTAANILMEYPAKVSDNGGVNDKLATMMKEAIDVSNKMRTIYQTITTNGTSQDSIEIIMNAEEKKLHDVYLTAMTENKDNILGAYILAMAATAIYNDLATLDSVMSEVKHADKIAQIAEYREALVGKEATQPGKMFIDFKGKNTDGSAAALSDWVGKGKYVLADFWASWCGPCRREIPNLVELQNKFGGDKFTVLGVNVWDKESEFKKALESEGINYPQIYASDNNDATSLYGIQGIPQIILFAPDGTIVKRDLRGQAMKQFVEEQLAK